MDLPSAGVALRPVPLKKRAELEERLNKMVKQINRFNERYHKSQLKGVKSGAISWNGPGSITLSLLEEDAPCRILDFMEGKTLDLGAARIEPFYQFEDGVKKEDLFSQDLELEPVHVVRLLYSINQIRTRRHNNHDYIFFARQELLDNYRKTCGKSFGLNELDIMVAGLPDSASKPGRVLQGYLYRNNESTQFCDWEPEAIWPAFENETQVLLEALTESRRLTSYSQERRQAAYKVLATFPVLPIDCHAVLWEAAFDEGKTDQKFAQRALDTVPDKLPTIIERLKDTKQAVRVAAADWLGRLGDRSAITPLINAIREETAEVAKVVMLVNLKRFGAEIDEFVDREKLLEEAKKGLSNKRPKGMDWIPLECLPVVHWSDSGEPVAQEILQWWVVQAVQIKLPDSNPLLQCYLSMCRKSDAQRFASFILYTWIDGDTRGIAANQKGMLSIVSAAGGDDCAKKCESYIKKWYGQKLAQCKALVIVLAHLDSKVALQILLSIANRFKTRTIRDLARLYVDQMAEKCGWSLVQLADRTVPDGGFARPLDEEGAPLAGSEAILELDFGPRQFIVKLDDSLNPVLLNKADGKVLKSLPIPGKSDDAEKAREAKKDFSDGKKVVKEVIKKQKERLYEAMCTQRAWSFEDWKLYLAEHPIVGRLCTRLIWNAYERPQNEKDEPLFLNSFRLIEDGSLTDNADEVLELKSDNLIKLAHTCNLEPQAEIAWKKHLQDYDVEPLFQQLDRVPWEPPESIDSVYEINEFEGHMISALRLRSKAERLGYSRGAIGDDGIFTCFHKEFASLGFDAVIEFSGGRSGPADSQVALICFCFYPHSKAKDYCQDVKINIGSVPPVLLAECYNDIKQIAADGNGYNENWKEVSLI